MQRLFQAWTTYIALLRPCPTELWISPTGYSITSLDNKKYFNFHFRGVTPIRNLYLIAKRILLALKISDQTLHFHLDAFSVPKKETFLFQETFFSVSCTWKTICLNWKLFITHKDSRSAYIPRRLRKTLL